MVLFNLFSFVIPSPIVAFQKLNFTDQKYTIYILNPDQFLNYNTDKKRCALDL